MKKEERYAGWRPRYKGVIDAKGYSLEYLSIDDPAFPELTKSILRHQKVKGRHIVTPISGEWKETLIEGSSQQLYLDFLNLECGANTLRRVRAIRKYLWNGSRNRKTVLRRHSVARGRDAIECCEASKRQSRPNA